MGGGAWVILEKKCLGFSQFGVRHMTSKEFLHASPKTVPAIVGCADRKAQSASRGVQALAWASLPSRLQVPLCVLCAFP